MSVLPAIHYEDLLPTRNYLQDIALVLGALQRGFLPENPHDWQHGLNVNLRGITTQGFLVKGNESFASLDLHVNKVRLGRDNWRLGEYDAPEILTNFKAWMSDLGVELALDEPIFSNASKGFDPIQASVYSEVLWWMNDRFGQIKTSLEQGLTSPVLLYPHHFDLSLVWFPKNDDKQLGIGFSTGDQVIPEPYVYITSYPEPNGFTDITLPEGCYWQNTEFSGAIMPYSILSKSQDPVESLNSFIKPTILVVKDPLYVTMCEELFGPVLTIYIYDENKFEETCELVDKTSIYALTGAVLATDRYAIQTALKKLVHAAGNFYINDKCTGAVVGQQPFGGSRASGTNDKAGSMINLLRWVSPRTIKETLVPATDYRYPFMSQE